MTVKSGFFNSDNGDRLYDAVDVSSMFDGLITDGVFEVVGDKLFTIQNTGMNVYVGTGKAWFNNTWTINDAGLVLAIEPSDLTNPRIDAVVLEVNKSNPVRQNTIKVITGTPAAIPAEPELLSGAEVNQYPLAFITVGAGVSSILTANINITVGTYLCPYVIYPQGGVVGVNVLEVQVYT